MELSNIIFTQPGFNEKPSAWIEHIPFAFFVVEKLKPAIFVELGTHYGTSYFAFCQAIEILHLKSKAFAVDLWSGDEHTGYYGNEVFEYVERVNNQNFSHFSNLLKMSFDDALALFEDNSVDLLHIDGLHTYEAVKHDFETWLPKMSPKGVIIFHDTNEKNEDFGVWKLMNDLRQQYPYFEFEHGHGLGILCTGKEVAQCFLAFVKESSGNTLVFNLFENLGKKNGLEQQNLWLKEEISQLRVKLDNSNQAKGFKDKEINQLAFELFNLRETIAEKENLLLTEISHSKQKQLEMAGEIQKLNNHIQGITGSYSWKITAPIRKVVSKLHIIKLILKSRLTKNDFNGLFDASYYLENNPDVLAAKINPLRHYLLFGGIEGRNPSEKFDSAYYLEQNPDVLKSGMNPLVHYLKYGQKEKRLPKTTGNSKLFATMMREPVFRLKTIPAHRQQVDIIVCVHNAPEDVKKCISSIIRFTSAPYHLILVDDGSNDETKYYLENINQTQQAQLIRNKKAVGYTKAANIGIKSSTAPYILLLNSDTIIGTANWLDRMVLCANKDEQVGIVSPLSNTASWQSIPELFSENDWCENKLPENFSIEQMASTLEHDADMIYPELPFLNGFCLLIKRACLNSTGYFDEINFPEGYGEENDFCIRAIKNNWKLAIADDVYIYHAQSKSYSHDRRLRLSNEAGIKLEKKHGSEIISSGVNVCRKSLILHGIRSRAAYYFQIQKVIDTSRQNYAGKKLLFVLPVTSLGGGANVIIQEISALRKMGIDCYIANFKDFRKSFETDYPSIEIPTIFFENSEELKKHLPYFDAMIGTAYISMHWINQTISTKEYETIYGYYIQDFEPYFFMEDSVMWRQAWESYTVIPEAKCFTKTAWNKNEVQINTGVHATIVNPSVNLEVFRPIKEKSFDNKILITAMIRPETPRRAPEQTMEVLQLIKKIHGNKVEIYSFGCKHHETLIQSYTNIFSFNHLGIISPSQMAILFNSTHIFIDMSSFQAMGLTGMEAMACANLVILPKEGGASSFINHTKNGFLIDTKTNDECLKVIDLLLADRNFMREIAFQAVKDICQFSPFFSAKNILECLFRAS